MTLQPLSLVISWDKPFLWSILFNVGKIVNVIVLSTARTERCIFSNRDGCSEQAANKLFLQNINCKWYQHSWRIFCPSPGSWESVSTTGALVRQKQIALFLWQFIGISREINLFIVATSLYYRISPNSHQLRNLLLVIFMMSSGSLGTFTEVSGMEF